MRKSVILIGCIILMVSFVQAVIQTADISGDEKNTFTDSDEIYLTSSLSLCNRVYNLVDIYVVESGSETLDDVRGDSQEITLTDRFAVPDETLIWSNPEPGDYDVIIDCQKDGVYSSLEPLASFSVVAEKGEGGAFVGENDPGSHSWDYDSEEDNLMNVMLQLGLFSEGENISLENMTLSFQGLLDGNEISRIEIFVDSNNDGELDDDEESIGFFNVESPLSENATVRITLDYVLEADEEENFLVVVRMEEDAEEGEISLDVKSVTGTGEDSNEVIVFSGFPIESGVKTISSESPEESCEGDLNLEMSPNPATQDSIITVVVSGIENCQNKRVSLREEDCDGDEVAFCISGSTGCHMSITSDESQTYSACIDKNSDGDTDDSGESSSVGLIVNKNGEASGEEDEEDTGPTGAASGLESFTESLTGAAGGFLILLELTLLLILFVLVMILFKLKTPGETDSDKKEEK
ncbi:hypothetical protein GF396_01745 [Candidatus Pacearchaeota archaeon]|nr:hypothetical protein [Candidatus Pacearchaeota archaeon]